MEINLKNIEEIIFRDRSAQTAVPRFKHLFDQYNLSFLSPGMRGLGQRSVLELLNSLDEESVAALSLHFGEDVSVDKLNHKISDQYECDIDSADGLCGFSGYKEFCITRIGKKLQASFWR